MRAMHRPAPRVKSSRSTPCFRKFAFPANSMVEKKSKCPPSTIQFKHVTCFAVAVKAIWRRKVKSSRFFFFLQNSNNHCKSRPCRGTGLGRNLGSPRIALRLWKGLEKAEKMNSILEESTPLPTAFSPQGASFPMTLPRFSERTAAPKFFQWAKERARRITKCKDTAVFLSGFSTVFVRSGGISNNLLSAKVF